MSESTLVNTFFIFCGFCAFGLVVYWVIKLVFLVLLGLVSLW